MGLGELVRDWDLLSRRVLDATRILVVDDEPAIRLVLQLSLRDAGFTVETAESAEDAWALIQARRYDLLVVDKNLPGWNGIELIDRVRRAGIALPSVMITGFPSPESIVAVLGKGASDYIIKPFDMTHTLVRLRSVLDRRSSGLLFDRIIQDLAATTTSGGIEHRSAERIKRALVGHRARLNARPQVLVVLPGATGIASCLRDEKLEVIEVHDAGTAVALVAEGDGPLTAVVPLVDVGSTDLVRSLRRADPALLILVHAQVDPPSLAFGAVAAGAADFFLESLETLDLLVRRVRRLAGQARRHALYLGLLSTLHREISREDAALAGTIESLASVIGSRLSSPDPGEAELDPGFELPDYSERSPPVLGDPLGDAPLRDAAT